MGNLRSARVRAAGVALLMVIATPGVTAAADKSPTLRADLNGSPLELAQVGNYYCHDFDYPVIHCFTQAGALEAAVASRSSTSAGPTKTRTGSATTATAAGTGNYVVIYDFTSYAGAYMYVSQDYVALGVVGWNDRISSFIVVSGQAGVFWTDWFYSGTRYGFCCSQAVPYLGSNDNAFSSVFRN